MLCGHSERRRDHGESDELVGQKAEAAGRHGLTPMICIGETGDERKAGRTFEVLERQLRAALASAPQGYALAYEPVLGDRHRRDRDAGDRPGGARLSAPSARRGWGQPADRIAVLYGGSVTPDNAAGLSAQTDIDGFLVGGASLDPRNFLTIIRVFWLRRSQSERA